MGVLVVVSRHLARLALDEKARTSREAGHRLGDVNASSRATGAAGPDPATIDAATVGGMVANNSGGMRCGVGEDSYPTVARDDLVLAVRHARRHRRGRRGGHLARESPSWHPGLVRIRDALRADPALAERVRRTFATKNTSATACRLPRRRHAGPDPAALIVGSEGTLAFIAEAIFHTLPIPARTTIAWLLFAGVETASKPVAPLAAASATAIELMRAPTRWPPRTRSPHKHPGRSCRRSPAALLVEFGGRRRRGLDARRSPRPRCSPPSSSSDRRIDPRHRGRGGAWGARGPVRPGGRGAPTGHRADHRGRLLAAGPHRRGGPRPAGPVPQSMASARRAGHAKAGNLHFTLTPEFGEAAARSYYAFIGDLVELVVDKYDGPLKAEHGTGRSMAPFVERHWGPEAIAVMWRVKRLLDPDGVLDPGVLLAAIPTRTSPPPDAAAGRDSASNLHRVRLLRAGVPEPRPLGEAAPAHRVAAPSRAQQRGPAVSAALAGAGRARRSTPAPPTARARSPARSTSTPAP